MIISYSSPLITHASYYVHAYLHKTPIGLTAFLMQIRRQLSPAADDGGRQDLFVAGNIVSDIEFVAEPFTAKGGPRCEQPFTSAAPVVYRGHSRSHHDVYTYTYNVCVNNSLKTEIQVKLCTVAKLHKEQQTLSLSSNSLFSSNYNLQTHDLIENYLLS